MDFWAQLFKWLDENLPKLFMAFTLGYWSGNNQSLDEKKKAALNQLDLEKLKNEKAITNKYAGLSSLDIIRKALSFRKQNK